MSNIDPTHPKFIDTDELRNDDTEGHVRAAFAVPDNEGTSEPESLHKLNNADDGDDTEGHIKAFSLTDDESGSGPEDFKSLVVDDDDTEGHIKAFSLTDDESGSGPEDFKALVVDDDDTDGHISLVSPGPASDDNPESFYGRL